MHNKCIENIHTGRTEPKNLNEQIAMKSAQSNPKIGHLNDPRLPLNAVKMEQIFNTSTGKIIIHYNSILNENVFFDFKLKIIRR